MRPPSLRAAAALLSLAFLAAAFPSGCSKKEEPASKPVVRKVVPKEKAVTAEATGYEAKAAPVAAQGPEFYNPSGKRDPFLPFVKPGPKVDPALLENLPPLQRYDLADFKFVGVIVDRKGHKALVEDRQGKGYTVLTGMKLGRQGGTVARITDSELVVKERYTDISGARYERENSLKLRTLSSGGNP
jgi:Tfp pilus assembly protein PilP